MFTARAILVLFGASVMFMAFRRLRAYRLSERYVLIFIFTGLPFLALSVWPRALGLVAEWLHIDYHTVSTLCVVAFLILMVFELLTIISLQERKIATLAQIVGIIMEQQGISDRRLSTNGDIRPGAKPAAAEEVLSQHEKV